MSALPTPLKPLAAKLEQAIDFSAAKVDELDKKFSGTLAGQAGQLEALLAQLGRDREMLGEVVLSALNEFEHEAQTTLAAQLLTVAQVQREYHAAAAATMGDLCATLRASSAALPPTRAARASPPPHGSAAAAELPIATIATIAHDAEDEAEEAEEQAQAQAEAEAEAEAEAGTAL